MNINYLKHALIPPILAQLQPASAMPYTLEAIFEQKEADFILLPAIYDFPAEWEIVAIPQRAKVKPVLVAIDEQIHFENFTRNLKIGVFSTLHQKMLEIHFPQVQAVLIEKTADILSLLEKKEIEGMFLPQFETQERGLSANIVQKCSLDVFTPSASEGIVFILGKKGNRFNEEIKKRLHHTHTEAACSYEKAFLAEMQKHTKGEIFAYATLFMDTVMLNVGIIEENGTSVSRLKVESKMNDFIPFIKNTVENVLLNK